MGLAAFPSTEPEATGSTRSLRLGGNSKGSCFDAKSKIDRVDLRSVVISPLDCVCLDIRATSDEYRSDSLRAAHN